MLLLRCSFDADSMSRSINFWPSTIATRSSSAWVALNNMRFMGFPRRNINRGQRGETAVQVLVQCGRLGATGGTALVGGVFLFANWRRCLAVSQARAQSAQATLDVRKQKFSHQVPRNSPLRAGRCRVR